MLWKGTVFRMKWHLMDNNVLIHTEKVVIEENAEHSSKVKLIF